MLCLSKIQVQKLWVWVSVRTGRRGNGGQRVGFYYEVSHVEQLGEITSCRFRSLKIIGDDGQMERIP